MYISFVEMGEPGADIGEIDTRFIKDQRGGGDIPVLAAAAGDGAVELAGGDLHQPIGQRGIGRAAGVMQARRLPFLRSEAHTSDIQSLMRTSYAVFCLTKKN